jgi:hypothetical protein
MTSFVRFAAIAALGLGLAACEGANVQPPIAGTTTGTQGASAVRAATDQIPQTQREATSAGAATLTGTAGGGQRAGGPGVAYSGPSSPTQLGGGIPQQYTPPIVRPRGN